MTYIVAATGVHITVYATVDQHGVTWVANRRKATKLNLTAARKLVRATTDPQNARLEIA